MWLERPLSRIRPIRRVFGVSRFHFNSIVTQSISSSKSLDGAAGGDGDALFWEEVS